MIAEGSQRGVQGQRRRVIGYKVERTANGEGTDIEPRVSVEQG